MKKLKNNEFSELNNQFQKIFAKILLSHSQLTTYIDCCIKGFNKIGKDLHEENYDFVIPQMTKIISNMEEVSKQYGSFEQYCAEFSAGMTKDIINQSVIVMEASSVILMHCILDISLYELILITSKTEKDYWKNRIDNNDIKFKEFLKHDKEAILTKRLGNRINKIERESVIDKCKYLLEICNPLQKERYVKDYTLNLKQLKKFDDKRHEIVHSSFKILDKEDAGNIVEYFRKTALFFCLMIREKYGFYIDTEQFTKIIPEFTRQPYSTVNLKKRGK